ncbi:MAG: primosomal protein N' [Desulfarculales bacterium]|jgi:primosomal protein N' (replication factor Y)|nr:primosomal protein N' [Desulfarculales bacterium]
MGGRINRPYLNMEIFQVDTVLSQVPQPLTYLVPGNLVPLVQPLRRLLVPLRNRQVTAFALSCPYPAPDPAPDLKPLNDVLDDIPSLPAAMLPFFAAAASYYQTHLGRLLELALPPGLGKLGVSGGGIKYQALISRLPLPSPVGLKPQAGQLLDIIDRHTPIFLDALKNLFPRASFWLPRLEEAGLIRISARARGYDLTEQCIISPETPPPVLSPEQTLALEGVSPAIVQGRFQSFLLHGVTGSGKTEIYMRACEQALAAGKGALLLVPEIGLCLRLYALMQDRFGPGQVAVLHSGLTPAQRRRQWTLLSGGQARLALGARSAIFAPLVNPGVICVDEEQDEAYKQEDRLRYNARDLALLRGREQSCPVILGSATPAVTTWYQAGQGRHRLLRLNRRIHDTPLPRMELIDLRSTPQLYGGFLSPRLHQALRANYAADRQAILFLNRRGFAPVMLCGQCGEKLICPACSSSFTWHQEAKRLVCHLCGRTRPLPPCCPNCRGPAEKFRALGLGTEAVEEKLRALEPQWRLARLDRDTAAAPAQLGKILQRMIDKEIDVLIGTQMLSKGHHFPYLTLVGVLMADQGLNQPDFRAAERAYTLLTQVAGRAGRRDEQGLVLVQSFNPHHHALRAALNHDEKSFYQRELQERRDLGYPPFSRLISLRLEAPLEKTAQEMAARLRAHLLGAVEKLQLKAQILGPAPAPVVKVKHRFRYYLLIKAGQAKEAAGILRLGLHNLGSLPGGARLAIDIDPLQFS